ncbi:Fur family transcriptional regulator [Mongoliitalea lutea]
MERLNEILKSHGIKPNTNRSLVIKCFIDDHRAHSLCTLHEILKGQMDRTTVYRNLILFTDKGILKKIPCSDGNFLFALITTKESNCNSPSFRCKCCQKVEELPELPQGYLDQIDNKYYFLESIALEGYCKDCK